MNCWSYYKNKIISKINGKGDEYVISSYRKEGMHIGENTHIFSAIITSEPYLISIGSNTTIATNVTMLTHDASIGVIFGREEASDLCGKIEIGNNCFIGSNATILPGVSISDYTIVAAGSVVTKSFIDGHVVIGGNPAKVLCTVQEYISKNQEHCLQLHGKSESERKRLICENEEKLLKK